MIGDIGIGYGHVLHQRLTQAQCRRRGDAQIVNTVIQGLKIVPACVGNRPANDRIRRRIGHGNAGIGQGTAGQIHCAIQRIGKGLRAAGQTHHKQETR